MGVCLRERNYALRMNCGLKRLGIGPLLLVQAFIFCATILKGEIMYEVTNGFNSHLQDLFVALIMNGCFLKQGRGRAEGLLSA